MLFALPPDHLQRILAEDQYHSAQLTPTSHQYRTSRTGNRQTRTTQIDHDVFEGLPVRHWRKKPVSVNAVPEKDAPKAAATLQNGYKELPLPRDFSMLPEHSQALLRAARMGLRKVAEAVEDDKENEDSEPGGIDGNSNFMQSKWSLVPRDLEGPEPEYLAKRRKGLPSVYSGITAPSVGGTSMRKTKIRKHDSQGNNSVLEVLVPEGQTVDGEIVEEETSPAQPLAPGTVIEGVGIVNAEGLVVAGEQIASAPARRRPPIPKKRKKHGPGRGRKKIAEPASGTEGKTIINGEMQENGTGNGDGAARGREENSEQIDGDDSIMHDAHQSDEEGSEEGSEAEDGEDVDREEGEISPSSSTAQILQPNGPTRIVDDSSPALSTAAKSPKSPDGDPSIPLTKPSPHVTEVDHVSPPPPATPAADAEDAFTAPAFIIDQPSSETSNTELPNDDVVSPVVEPQAVAANETSNEIFSDNEQPAPIEQIATESREASVAQASPPIVPTATEAIGSFNVGEPMAPPLAEAVLPQSDPLTNDIINPVPLPLPTEVDIKSPPPIPQTLAKFPEPPSTLPQKMPPSPPQRRPQPPSLPPDHPRRPSGSTPEAPTPSPPTPIETTFDHPPQGLSPKAPTMSPPTPIAQELDSSPETALAHQQRRLFDPPPLSLGPSISEAPRPVIPGLNQHPPIDRLKVEAATPLSEPNFNAGIPQAHDPLDGLAAPEIPPDHRKLDARTKAPSPTKQSPDLHEGGIEVEAAPRVDNPAMDAEIPHEHNPLDGFKAPEIPPEQHKISQKEQNEEMREPVRFEDGEEDLLGTLERDLGPPQLLKR